VGKGWVGGRGGNLLLPGKEVDYGEKGRNEWPGYFRGKLKGKKGHRLGGGDLLLAAFQPKKGRGGATGKVEFTPAVFKGPGKLESWEKKGGFSFGEGGEKKKLAAPTTTEGGSRGKKKTTSPRAQKGGSPLRGD